MHPQNPSVKSVKATIGNIEFLKVAFTNMKTRRRFTR